MTTEINRISCSLLSQTPALGSGGTGTQQSSPSAAWQQKSQRTPELQTCALRSSFRWHGKALFRDTPHVVWRPHRCAEANSKARHPHTPGSSVPSEPPAGKEQSERSPLPSHTIHTVGKEPCNGQRILT